MPRKNLQAKKNHHYVWAYHLQQWSADGKTVWYTTPSGKVSCHSIRDICREDYFYRSSVLTAHHIEMISGFSRLSDAELQGMHAKYLSDILLLQKLEELYRNSGKSDEEAEQLIESAKCNIIENYHSAHENEFKPILLCLRNSDLTPLKNETSLIHLFTFLGQQLARTRSAKDLAIEAVQRIGPQSVDQKHFQEIFEECWFFISYMFGLNVGFSLFMTRKTCSICLLVNDGPEPFITSDVPVTNLSGRDVQNGPHDTDQADFYYPLSPDRALVVSYSDAFPTGIHKVSNSVVEEINFRLARQARAHIIGDNKDVIRRYRGAINQQKHF